MGILQQALTICMAISGMMFGLLVVFALIQVWLMFLKYHSDSGDLPDMFSKPEINQGCGCDSCGDVNARSQAIYYALMGVLHQYGLDELLREFNDTRQNEEIFGDAEPATSARSELDGGGPVMDAEFESPVRDDEFADSDDHSPPKSEV